MEWGEGGGERERGKLTFWYRSIWDVVKELICRPRPAVTWLAMAMVWPIATTCFFFDIKIAFISMSFFASKNFFAGKGIGVSFGTMAANIKKSSPWSLPIFLSLLPIFVKVAKHITTRVSHVARLINGPRLSGVTRTWFGCSGGILVCVFVCVFFYIYIFFLLLLQLLDFLDRIHEAGKKGRVVRGWGYVGGGGRNGSRLISDREKWKFFSCFFSFFKVWDGHVIVLLRIIMVGLCVWVVLHTTSMFAA